MRALVLACCLWSTAASAQGVLTEAELRECLAGLVEFTLVPLQHEPRSDVFRGQSTPPLGEDTEWRRNDRVLTIDNGQRRQAPFVPFDPTRWSYQDLHFRHFLAAPIISLGFHGEAGPLLSPIGAGASLLLFPGGLAPYAPFNERMALELPPNATDYGTTVELRLLPIDAIDVTGKSFIRDFGEEICNPEIAPGNIEDPEDEGGRRRG